MNLARRKWNGVFCGLAGVLLSWFAAFSSQAQVAQTNLPPAAAVQVDFNRDIKPILDQSCLRCHGPERPRSRFRLDNRAAALQGGENGVDIIAGNSANSPLIRYVARLDPDVAMPPEGKGEPLTDAQVGLLRAWIDQGVSWGTEVPINLFDLALSPRGGWTFVKGDHQKFREQNYKHEGVDAGLDSFELFAQPDSESRVTASGHALINDYQVVLDMKRNDLGFVHSGWQQYRRYYDDTGGYFPASSTQAPVSLGTDPYLDIGKAWVDFGLTLPHWPQMVVGYEYDYRRGTEATTSWQWNGFPRPLNLNIGPATKEIDESTHVIKFELNAEVKGYTIEDRFRGEFYKLNTAYTNVAVRDEVSQNVKDSNSYFQGANSIRVEKRFKKWLMASGGYFYSKLNADDLFTNNVIYSGQPFPASVPEIALERQSHVVNLNGLLGPFYGLSLIAGVQSEWTRQEGFGSGTLNGIAFTSGPGDLSTHPATLGANYQDTTVSENIGLRFNKIPYTSLFADARLRQQNIDQTDSDIQSGAQSFSESPSFRSRSTDFRGGFNTSPWQSVSFTAHYRRYEDDSHYNTNQVPQPVGGYPGFIAWRDLVTDEVEAKLVFRPFLWLKTSLSYQYAQTDFREDTRMAFDPISPALSPGGGLLAGRDDSNIYSVSATVIPHRRVYLSSTFSYRNSKLTTASAGAIPPYEGDIFSLLASATYILDQATDLLASYSCSIGDYSPEPGAPNASHSPPLGLRYQQHALQAGLSHRFSKNCSGRVQYGYYMYDEPPALGVNNYTAHMIFASVTYHMH